MFCNPLFLGVQWRGWSTGFNHNKQSYSRLRESDKKVTSSADLMVNIFSRVNSIVAEAGRKVEQKYLRLCEKTLIKNKQIKARLRKTFLLPGSEDKQSSLYVCIYTSALSSKISFLRW